MELIKGKNRTKKVLGRGAYSEVVLITYRAAEMEVVYQYFETFTASSLQMAIVPAAEKRYLVDDGDTISGAALFALKNEAETLAQLRHPNIISMCLRLYENDIQCSSLRLYRNAY